MFLLCYSMTWFWWPKFLFLEEWEGLCKNFCSLCAAFCPFFLMLSAVSREVQYTVVSLTCKSEPVQICFNCTSIQATASFPCLITRIHLMAGRVPLGSQRPAVAKEMEAIFVRNLNYAADILSKVGDLFFPIRQEHQLSAGASCKNPS